MVHNCYISTIYILPEINGLELLPATVIINIGQLIFVHVNFRILPVCIW